MAKKKGKSGFEKWWDSLWKAQPKKKPKKKRGKPKKPKRAKKWPILHFFKLSWIPAAVEWEQKETKAMSARDKARRKRAAERVDRRRARRAARKGGGQEYLQGKDGKLRGSTSDADRPGSRHGRSSRRDIARGDVPGAEAPMVAPEDDGLDNVEYDGRTFMLRKRQEGLPGVQAPQSMADRIAQARENAAE